MNTSVEISYYPLKDDYLKPIGDFIDRLNTYDQLTIRTSGISTHVFGKYNKVMEAITAEMKKSFELPHSVFVMKIINTDLQSIPK